MTNNEQGKWSYSACGLLKVWVLQFPVLSNPLNFPKIQSWWNIFFRGCGSDQYIGAIIHNHSPFFWKIVNTSIISTSVILILSFHLGLDWMCCAPYLFEWPRFFPRRKIQFCRIESGLLCPRLRGCPSFLLHIIPPSSHPIHSAFRSASSSLDFWRGRGGSRKNPK